MARFTLFVILLAAAVLLVSCAVTQPLAPDALQTNAADSTGSLSLETTFEAPKAGGLFPGARSATGVVKVSGGDFATGTVILTRTGVRLEYPLNIQGGTAKASISNLAAAAWTIQAKFFNAAGEETYSGTTTVDILRSKVVTVRLLLGKTGGTLDLVVDLPVSPEGLVLWNKMGSEDDFNKDYLGISLARVGQIAFTPSRFNNGSAFSNLSWIQSSALIQNVATKGTIEFWITVDPTFMGENIGLYPPARASIFAPPADGGKIPGEWVCPIVRGTGLTASTLWQGFAVWNGFSLMTATIVRDSGETFVPDYLPTGKEQPPGTYYPYDHGLKVTLSYPGASLTIPAGSIPYLSSGHIHLAFAWNKDGIAGSTDKTRIYANGALIAQSSEGLAGAMPNDLLLILGSDNANGTAKSTLHCPMDNVKLWSLDKVDYSDIQTESF